MSNFVALARLGELKPGQMKRCAVQGKFILLANVDGCFYAIDDACTHEEASLSLGALRGEWVKCPLHGSRFNVRTGAVSDEPATDPVRTYAVQVEGDLILAELS